MATVKWRDSYGDKDSRHFETEAEATAFYEGMSLVIAEFSCDMAILEDEG